MGLFEPDKYRTKEKEEREIDRFDVVIEGADKKALRARRRTRAHHRRIGRTSRVTWPTSPAPT